MLFFRSVRRPVVAALLAGASATCQPAIPPYTLDVPPRLVDVRPPRSVAFVHGDVPLGGLRSAIEGAIPAEVAGSRKASLLGLRDVELTWRLERRPVALRAEKNGLSLEIALLGEVSVNGDGVHCRAGDAGVVFTVDTSPTLRNEGELALDHLRWKPEPRGTLVCGAIPVPLGALLGLAIEPLANALAKGVAEIRIPVGPALDAALDGLRAPMSVKLGEKVGEACLDLDPSRLVLSPVGGAGAEMRLVVGVDVAPRVTLGPCQHPPKAEPRTGPLVEVRPLQDQFEVAVAVAVPYAELRARAAPLVVGQSFGEGDHHVTLDDVDVGDAGGHVLVRLRLHGTLNGTLYLWGTPVIAQRGERWVLEVPDLQVTLDSRSLLDQLLLVAWKLKDGGLEAMLAQKLTLDVTDRLAEARAALSRRFVLTAGSPAPVLTTTLTRIRPGEVASQPGALVLQPILGGRAELTIESRPAPE